MDATGGRSQSLYLSQQIRQAQTELDESTVDQQVQTGLQGEAFDPYEGTIEDLYFTSNLQDVRGLYNLSRYGEDISVPHQSPYNQGTGNYTPANHVGPEFPLLGQDESVDFDEWLRRMTDEDEASFGEERIPAEGDLQPDDSATIANHGAYVDLSNDSAFAPLQPAATQPESTKFGHDNHHDDEGRIAGSHALDPAFVPLPTTANFYESAPFDNDNGNDDGEVGEGDQSRQSSTPAVGRCRDPTKQCEQSLSCNRVAERIPGHYDDKQLCNRHRAQWENKNCGPPQWQPLVFSTQEALELIRPNFKVPEEYKSKHWQDPSLHEHQHGLNEWTMRFHQAAMLPYEGEEGDDADAYRLVSHQNTFSSKAKSRRLTDYRETMIGGRLSLLFPIALRIHQGGPAIYCTGGDSSGYGKGNFQISFVERLRLIESVLKTNKRIAMDVIEGRGVEAFVKDPESFLKRKNTNKKGNTARSKKMADESRRSSLAPDDPADAQDEDDGAEPSASSSLHQPKPPTRKRKRPVKGQDGDEDATPASAVTLYPWRKRAPRRRATTPAASSSPAPVDVTSVLESSFGPAAPEAEMYGPGPGAFNNVNHLNADNYASSQMNQGASDTFSGPGSIYHSPPYRSSYGTNEAAYQYPPPPAPDAPMHPYHISTAESQDGLNAGHQIQGFVAAPASFVPAAAPINAVKASPTMHLAMQASPTRPPSTVPSSVAASSRLPYGQVINQRPMRYQQALLFAHMASRMVFRRYEADGEVRYPGESTPAPVRRPTPMTAPAPAPGPTSVPTHSARAVPTQELQQGQQYGGGRSDAAGGATGSPFLL